MRKNLLFICVIAVISITLVGCSSVALKRAFIPMGVQGTDCPTITTERNADGFMVDVNETLRYDLTDSTWKSFHESGQDVKDYNEFIVSLNESVTRWDKGSLHDTMPISIPTIQLWDCVAEKNIWWNPGGRWEIPKMPYINIGSFRYLMPSADPAITNGAINNLNGVMHLLYYIEDIFAGDIAIDSAASDVAGIIPALAGAIKSGAVYVCTTNPGDQIEFYSSDQGRELIATIGIGIVAAKHLPAPKLPALAAGLEMEGVVTMGLRWPKYGFAHFGGLIARAERWTFTEGVSSVAKHFYKRYEEYLTPSGINTNMIDETMRNMWFKKYHDIVMEASPNIKDRMASIDDVLASPGYPKAMQAFAEDAAKLVNERLTNPEVRWFPQPSFTPGELGPNGLFDMVCYSVETQEIVICSSTGAIRTYYCAEEASFLKTLASEANTSLLEKAIRIATIKNAQQNLLMAFMVPYVKKE